MVVSLLVTTPLSARGWVDDYQIKFIKFTHHRILASLLAQLFSRYPNFIKTPLLPLAGNNFIQV